MLERPNLRLLAVLAALTAGLAAPPGYGAVRAWYPLDDGTATDASGNGNDGELFGTPVSDSGIVGLSLLFAPTDFISVPHSPGLDIGTPNVVMWIKFGDSVISQARQLIRKTDGQRGFRILLLGSGRIRFEVGDGLTVASVTSPFAVMPGVWTAITASYNGSSLRLYLHGELAAQTSAPGLDPSNEEPVVISNGFDGNIDEIRLGSGGVNARQACSRALKVWHGSSATCIPSFTEVAAAEGIEDTHHRTFGATLVDIDQDGWIDLYYVNGGGDPDLPDTDTGVCPDFPDPIPFAEGSANALHMNLGSGTFGPDTALEVGLADEWNAMRHVWADYDRDGLRDVVSHNFIVSTLYKQVLGDPMTFEDWNDESGTHICLTKGTGASWIDLNNDGFLDLHVVEYGAGRLAIDHLNQTYLSDGFGGFIDITDASGLNLPDNPMGQAWADFDNDGDQDLFQTNSHEVPTRLYQNDGIDVGTGVPTFTDIAASAGVAVIGEPNRGIGASWGDYNNDRMLDLLFSREGDSRLFRNDGPDTNGDWKFTDVSNEGGFETVLGLGFWGGGFADLDNDGWLDIVLSNRSNGPNRVLLNNGDETFREVTLALDMELNHIPSMGFVAGDRDNDGDLDVVIVAHTSNSFAPAGTGFEGDPNAVYVNNERGNNWIQFRLTGTESNLEAVGARILVRARLQPGEPPIWQSREVNAGTGFFSDFPRIQTFGLGKAAVVDKVLIRWPNGIVQQIGRFDVNARYDIVEPLPVSPTDRVKTQ